MSLPRVVLPPAFLRQPIAHRGWHDRDQGRPENSPAAIRAAVAAGYGIEIDLQLSLDDAAVVFHDDRLERLTEHTGPLRERTAVELGAILLRDAEDGIPTLAAVLEIVAGQVPLLIEIKDQERLPEGRIGPLEAAAARALEGYGGPVAVMSFNPASIAAFGALRPDLPRGLVTCAFDDDGPDSQPEAIRARLREIPDYDDLGASFISHHWRDLARPRVAALKARGAHVLCWTVRSPVEEREARRIAENVTFEGYPAALLPA